MRECVRTCSSKVTGLRDVHPDEYLDAARAIPLELTRDSDETVQRNASENLELYKD